MKWYARRAGLKNEPYPNFLGDVTWSTVCVLSMGAVMFIVGVGVPWIAAACSAATLGLAGMIVRRRAEYRARMGLVPRRGIGVTPLTRSRPRQVLGN